MKQRKAFSYGSRFEKLMSAITFAEAGEHEEARKIMKGRETVLLALSDRVFDRNALSSISPISQVFSIAKCNLSYFNATMI